MIIYTVQAGDSIYTIAEKYGVSYEWLADVNEISSPYSLVIGQTVVIPSDGDKLRTIAVNGYTYTNINMETYERTLPNLSFVTIFTYGFTPDGSLIIPDDEQLIASARNAGVAPIMLISTLTESGNFSNELSNAVLNDASAQQNLINNIIANLYTKNYYALDIDFEFVFPEDREAYASFVNNVTQQLNAEGFPVIVSLAPKTSSQQVGLLYEAHDYFLLGQAANAVLLMTYEWGYTYGPPLPVAPLNKVREVLDYAVTQIEPQKIFLGIPNYGYDWTLPYIQGESRARSLSSVQAVELAQRYGSIIQYDEEAATPFFTYYDENGAEHIVYFEDARSIYEKLKLITEYGFAGASYWNIMNFFPQNWLVLNSMYDIFKV